MSKALVVATKAHASLGASVAARWMACPGSVRLSEGLPNPESEHAKLGTAAHALAELCLRHGTEPAAYIDTEVEGVEVDEDMTDAVEVFVNFCREKMATATMHGIEQRFNLAPLNPPGPMFGTSDFWSYDAASRTLDVADYKNGSGVVVEAAGNKQLRYYGLGAALLLPKGTLIDTVNLHIVQPRAYHPEGVVRTDTMSYTDLLDFAGELMDAARATMDPAAQLHAGPHCRFCRAAAICPEQKRIAQEVALTEFEALPLAGPPAPETLSVVELADIGAKLHILEDWAKNVRSHMAGLLARGEVTSAELGQKLVAKRAKRGWKDEEEVATWLREVKGLTNDEIFNQTIKSPAQIEKRIGKKKKDALPEEWISKRSSGYNMVSIDDKRPEVLLDPAHEFTAITSGDD